MSLSIGKRSISQSSFGIDRSSEHMQTHKNFSQTNGKVNESASCMGNHFPSGNVRAVEARKSLVGQSQTRASTVDHSRSQFMDRSFGSHTVHIGQVKDSAAEILAGDVDDDDLLEVILIQYELH